MTTATLQLALPELDLVQRDCGLLDPEGNDRDLIVARDILDLVDVLRHAIQIHRNLVMRP